MNVTGVLWLLYPLLGLMAFVSFAIIETLINLDGIFDRSCVHLFLSSIFYFYAAFSSGSDLVNHIGLFSYGSVSK